MYKPSIKTYITYFDDRQVDEYNLKASDDVVLFKGNDTSYSGETINYLNTYYCELCTLYYVWKNNLKSDYVVFKQYRRSFDWKSVKRLPDNGEVICYYPIWMHESVIMQYAICHGRKRATDLMELLGEMYGKKSDCYGYFKNSSMLYTNNTMVLKWSDFCSMCEFVFGMLDEIDDFYGLSYDAEKYADNAYKYTEDNRYDYQTHWMAYIGERLVSCYIATKMKGIYVNRPEGNGFYKPYERK